MRPKRSVRASGVGRSLGASQGPLHRCLECRRDLPREAIAHIGRTRIPDGYPHAGKIGVFCGQCWPGYERRVMRQAFEEAIRRELTRAEEDHLADVEGDEGGAG